MDDYSNWKPLPDEQLDWGPMEFDPPKLELEFAFRMRLQLGARIKMGRVPQGGIRGFTAAAGGIIEGPLLNGRVIGGTGGDWPIYRDDHAVVFSAHYMLEADDGTKIYLQNKGFRYAPPDVAARQEALEPVGFDEYYMRVTPTFDVETGPHDWLTKNILVGCAQRNPDHSVFHFYLLK